MLTSRLEKPSIERKRGRRGRRPRSRGARFAQECYLSRLCTWSITERCSGASNRHQIPVNS